MDNKLLDVKGICEFLSISRSSLYREMDKGMPYVMIGGNKRFEKDVVLEYYKNKTKGGY